MLLTLLLHSSVFNLNIAESIMLNQLATPAERIGGSNELVDNWLYNRKQLLVHYYNPAGITPKRLVHAAE